MKKISVGWSLSFDNTFDNRTSSLLSSICRYNDKKGKFYLQSPCLDEVNEVLSSVGYYIFLEPDAVKQYDKMKRVRLVHDPEEREFRFYFNVYPSYPYFYNNVEKKFTWLNMTKRAGKERPVYISKLTYDAMHATEWLRREGYSVMVSDSAARYFPPEPGRSPPSPLQDGRGKIESMDKSVSFELKPHQVDAVNEIAMMNYKGIIGDDAGMGKTIEAGEIIYNLWKDGKANNALWVVPTSPLVKQVLEEMKGRYGLKGVAVTGQSMTRQERLGIETDGRTIYEKHGFIVTTWSMFLRDFTGDEYHEITRKVRIDIIVLDEGHRAQRGNTSYDATLNVSAPYRIMLSGTIMPNGDWRELHSMVSVISPSFLMAWWYFSGIERKKREEYDNKSFKIHRSGKAKKIDAGHKAKKHVTKMVLARLMKKVTRHSKDEVSDYLPDLAEVNVHVKPNSDENRVIEILIEILSTTIERWQSLFRFRKSDDQNKRKYFKTVENAKNVLWQDLRRFCTHGFFSLNRRMDAILSGKNKVNEWLKENYAKDLIKVRDLALNGNIRDQPKNEEVLSVIRRGDPERCLIFNDSVKGCIDLAKELVERGMEARVIVGSDDQLTREDADKIGQSHVIDDDEIESILEWFWFPWITISTLARLEGITTMYTSINGKKYNNIYYVDGHKLGKTFTITLEWKKKVSGTVFKEILSIIDILSSSPAITVDAEVPPDKTAPGRVIISIKLTNDKDRRILVATDKLNEGANIQVANLIIFYDQPMSIKQKEQRIARSRRMESMHDSIGLVSLLFGLDYAVSRNLEMKYDSATRLGYADPKPVSMKNVMRIVKAKPVTHVESEKKTKQPDIFDFLKKG